MNAEQIETEIVSYLRDELRVPEAELDRDAKLVGSGVLDSVSLLQVATHMERVFDVEVPDQDIDAEHMDSIAMMVDYVLRAQQG